MQITFGSVCSGIEAASVAFAPLGWIAVWLSEIEAFPSAVLAHHYPEAPNLGDMRLLPAMVRAGAADAPAVLCGGTPCQAFSVAGKRQSLADERGNLSLTFCELADAIDDVRTARGDDEAVIVWENVPGVLSTKDNAFGCFLAGLAGEDEPLVPPGKRWTDAGAVYGPRRAVAWRTLDAQYFGLAQRRRRVFVVASARNGFDPAQVLFEWEGVRRDSPPSRGATEKPAPTVAGGARKRGGCSHDDIPLAGTLNAGMGRRGAEDPERDLLAFGGNQTSGPRDISSALSALSAHGGTGRMDFESETFIAFDTTQITSAENRSNPQAGQPCHPLAAGANPPAIAFDCKASGQSGFGIGEIADTQCAMGHADSHSNGGGHQAVLAASSVRRLTPVECERLQGFPDDYTRIPTWSGWRKLDASETPEQCVAEGLEVRQNKKTGRWRVRDVDGPRYKALGNSWAVPCARWVGQRIATHIERQALRAAA